MFNELHRETTVLRSTKLKGLSEKLIVSHWRTTTRRAVRRLNASTAQLTELDCPEGATNCTSTALGGDGTPVASSTRR